MLVLSRKQQQLIRIGDDVTITILKIKGQAVRVGVEAPRGVRVLRGELRQFDNEGPEVHASEEPGEHESASAVDWQAAPPLPSEGRGLRGAMEAFQPAATPGAGASEWRSKESAVAPLAGRIGRSGR